MNDIIKYRTRFNLILFVLTLNLILNFLTPYIITKFFSSPFNSIFLECFRLIITLFLKYAGFFLSVIIILSSKEIKTVCPVNIKFVKFSPFLLFLLPAVILITGMITSFILSSFFNYKTITENNEIIIASSSFSVYIVYFISVVIIPAVFEEYLFRGLIMRLLSETSIKFAIITQAILFGLMHANPEKIFYAAAGGLILGYVTKIYNSQIPSMILHLFCNFIFFLLTTFYRNGLFIGIMILAIFTSGILSMVILLIKGYFKQLKEYNPQSKQYFETFWLSFPAFVYIAVFTIISLRYFYI